MQCAVGFKQLPFTVVKATSGGIRFSVLQPRDRRDSFCLSLLKKDCTHKLAYKIAFSAKGCLYDAYKNERIEFTIPNFYHLNIYDFWVTWFNNIIALGKVNEPALFEYSEVISKEMIGFVQFETLNVENGSYTVWNILSTPVIHGPMTVPKKVSGGELRWVSMNKESTLPNDALIGGLEDEPLYIARAMHRGSLCPGKYVKSEGLAFIPWGHEAHTKDEFEILCGYDAMWVKCKGDQIPENAFIGGYSEVHHEPLYIGRAWVRNDLLVGKVHMLYKTCYLPFFKKELEKSEYEILVVGNKICRGETTNSPCYMKMVMEPCL